MKGNDHIGDTTRKINVEPEILRTQNPSGNPEKHLNQTIKPSFSGSSCESLGGYTHFPLNPIGDTPKLWKDPIGDPIERIKDHPFSTEP